MVARVARIRGNLLQVVTDELPENLSCVVAGEFVLCSIEFM